MTAALRGALLVCAVWVPAVPVSALVLEPPCPEEHQITASLGVCLRLPEWRMVGMAPPARMTLAFEKRDTPDGVERTAEIFAIRRPQELPAYDAPDAARAFTVSALRSVGLDLRPATDLVLFQRGKGLFIFRNDTAAENEGIRFVAMIASEHQQALVVYSSSGPMQETDYLAMNMLLWSLRFWAH